MPDDNAEIYQKLKFHGTVVSFLLVFTLVFTMTMTSAMIWWAYKSGRQSAAFTALADQNRDVLCSFKFDLKRRYDEGKAYLAAHPDGIPGVLTAEELKLSLDNQRSVLTAFAQLRCVGAG